MSVIESVARIFGNKPKPIDEVCLHIGFHKSGSSHIQQALYRNRHLLLEQGVSLICRKHYEREMDQGNAAYVLRRKKRLLKQLKRAQGRVIISSEDMSWWDMDKIKALKNHLYRYTDRVRIIAYGRNHADFAVSMKQQGVKTQHIGRVFGYTESLLPELTDKVKRRVSFNRTLSRWQKVFPVATIHFATLDFLGQAGLPLLKHFCEWADIDLGDSEPDKRVNASLDYYWQLFLSRHQDLFHLNTALRLKMLPEILHASNPKDRRRITSAERRAFDKAFEPDARELENKFGRCALMETRADEEAAFVFREKKYQLVRSLFITIYCNSVVALTQDRQLRSREREVVVQALKPLSKDAANDLAARLKAI